MYTAVDLSKYIVNKCIADGHPISNLQLQKILYYIQKDFLSNGEREAAFSDKIQAWQFGPVVVSTYYHYCHFGGMRITILESPFEIEAKDKRRIDHIVERKRDLPPWDLVAETHKPGGAWARIYRNGEGYGEVIPQKLIRQEG